MRDDVVDHGLVDARVRRVRDDREGVVLAAVDAPQLAAVADERRDRCVDDDVRRDVQVREALVGVGVRHAGAVLEARGERCGDLVAALDRGQPREDRPETVVGGEARGGDLVAVAVEDVREVGLHDVAEDDRVADLHHRGLEVHRVEDVLGLRRRRSSRARKASRALAERKVPSMISPGSTFTPDLRTVGSAVGGDVLDAVACPLVSRRCRRPSPIAVHCGPSRVDPEGLVGRQERRGFRARAARAETCVASRAAFRGSSPMSPYCSPGLCVYWIEDIPTEHNRHACSTRQRGDPGLLVGRRGGPGDPRSLARVTRQ